MSEDENHLMREWRADIAERAQGRTHAVNRGIARVRNGTASGSWRCEGRDQAAEQMDIWGCIEQAEQDEEASP